MRKGFDGDLLDRIVATITANPDVWVAVMMAEEHQLAPVDRVQALRSACVVGVSAIVGSLIPLAPFAVLPVNASMGVAIAIGALVLFAVGAYKARLTVGHPGWSGRELAVIGTVSDRRIWSWCITQGSHNTIAKRGSASMVICCPLWCIGAPSISLL
jgi:hypothetical protein